MQLLPRPILRSTIPLIAAAVLSIAIAFSALGVGAIGLVFLAALIIAGQWFVAPYLLRWLTKPRFIEHDGLRYLVPPGSPDARVANLVAYRCTTLGLPLVALGITADRQPNAFTFGRRRCSSTIVVSQSLIDALDDDELDAVVCHELAHIEHRDVILMTCAAIVPLLLSLAGRMCIDLEAGDTDDDEGGGLILIGIGLLLLSFLADLLILGLSRSREYAADRRSCEVTGNGDALATALVMASRPVKAGRHNERLDTASVLAFTNANPSGQDLPRTPEGIVRALRADLGSGRLRFGEYFSTHPSVARRIAALERSGLPGAPTRFGLTTDH